MEQKILIETNCTNNIQTGETIFCSCHFKSDCRLFQLRKKGSYFYMKIIYCLIYHNIIVFILRYKLEASSCEQGLYAKKTDAEFIMSGVESRKPRILEEGITRNNLEKKCNTYIAKLNISLDQQHKTLYSLFLLYAQLRAMEVYCN